MLGNKDPKTKQHLIITLVLSLLALWSGLLAALSLLTGTLLSPIFSTLSESPAPSYYFGASIYITIGATLLTTVVIRIALRITK